MMQIPSSNQSHTSSRSAVSRTAAIVQWFDGVLCCTSGYEASDTFDENSVAYSENDSSNFYSSRSNKTRCRNASLLFDAAEESTLFTTMTGVRPDRITPTKQPRTSQGNGRSFMMQDLPISPSSDATATTVLSVSTTSSHATNPLGNCPRDKQHRNYQHQRRNTSSNPREPKMPTPSTHARSHSTGNIVTPEEEWEQQQQQAQLHEARILAKPTTTPKRNIPAKEVVIPENWSHTYGLRRMLSETLPKLPFATVKPSYRV